VDVESALNVVDKAEELVCLLKGNDIHEASWIGVVGSDLAVNLDQALSANLDCFLIGQSVLETVSQEDDGRQALAQLVWTWAWSWRKDAAQLVQHPVLWRMETLHMLPSSSVTHFVTSLLSKYTVNEEYICI